MNGGTHMNCWRAVFIAHLFTFIFWHSQLEQSSWRLECVSSLVISVIYKSRFSEGPILCRCRCFSSWKRQDFSREKFSQIFQPLRAVTLLPLLITSYISTSVSAVGGFSEKWRILFRISTTLTCFKHHYKFWWCCDGISVGVRNNQCNVQYEQSVQSMKCLATVPDKVTFSGIHVCN